MVSLDALLVRSQDKEDSLVIARAALVLLGLVIVIRLVVVAAAAVLDREAGGEGSGSDGGHCDCLRVKA